MCVHFWRGESHRLRDLDFLTAGKSYCLRTPYIIYRLGKTAVNSDGNNNKLHYICKTMLVNVRIHL